MAIRALPRPDLLTGYLICGLALMVLLLAATLFVHRDGFLLAHGKSLVIVNGMTVPFESCTYFGAAGLVRRLPVQDAATGKTRC